MSDILFKCGSCGRHLVVDDAGIGQTINCPDCGKPILLTKSVSQFECPFCNQVFQLAQLMNGEMVICPSCKIEVQIPSEHTTAPFESGKKTKKYPACVEEILGVAESLSDEFDNSDLPRTEPKDSTSSAGSTDTAGNVFLGAVIGLVIGVCIIIEGFDLNPQTTQAFLKLCLFASPFGIIGAIIGSATRK